MSDKVGLAFLGFWLAVGFGCAADSYRDAAVVSACLETNPIAECKKALPKIEVLMDLKPKKP